MYDKLVKALRNCAYPYSLHRCRNCFLADESGASCGMKRLTSAAADAIEKLSRNEDDLCKTIDMYRKELGGHPDPRGPEGPSGIKEAEP